MKDILADGQIGIDGSGGQTRDFVFVGDLCAAIDSALQFDGGGEIFQVGTGTETSVAELAQLIVDTSNHDVEINYGPTRAGDVARNYSDITKARSMLNWSPEVELAYGISETWQWFERAMGAAE